MLEKTNQLTGAALDWAVAICEGHKVNVGFRNLTYIPKGKRTLYNYSPSTNWAQGGPIIERENMPISHSPYDHVFYGRTRPWCAEKKGRMEYGPTPLIAAMRCYVASKLGDEVEIPAELTQGETK
jgi:hypothetical protein